jgi:hypothetical protein
VCCGFSSVLEHSAFSDGFDNLVKFGLNEAFSDSGRVPLYSVDGLPVCAFVAGLSSLPALDSGATYHFTGDLSLFVGPVAPVDTPVSGIDSTSALRATGFGSIGAELGGQRLTLSDAFYVPGLEHTLISVRGLVKSPCASCTFTNSGVRLVLSDLDAPIWAPSSTGLFILSQFTPLSSSPTIPLGFYIDKRRAVPQPNTHTGKISLATLLHHRCGHVSFGNKHLTSAMKEAYVAKFDPASCGFCDSCTLAKMHTLRSGLPGSLKATAPLERVHFDVVFGVPMMGIAIG